MSDEAGTDAATGAPNEAATEQPVAVVEPVVEAKPVDDKPKPPPKPRTIDDDLEDVLKKHGGLKYKAGGKEKSITAAKDLTRYLSRVDGTEDVATEALKVREAEAGRKAKIAALAKMRPAERVRELEAMGFDPALIRSTFEDVILSERDEEIEREKLSPREREYQAQIQKQDAELAKLRERDEAAENERKEQAWAQESGGLLEEMKAAAGGAFAAAGIKTSQPELVTAILPALADRIDRTKRLGLELDSKDLAEVVTKERTKIVDEWNQARPLDDLSASLEAMQVDNPDRPGEKISKLRALMLHEAAKIRARHLGTPTPTRAPTPGATSMTNGHQQTKEELMDAARTFGGGSR